jgi:TrmH family RNA methyltransferase
MITSTHNPKIKWVRELQSDPDARREAGVLVVEGVRLAEEALAAGWQAKLLLTSDELSPRGRSVVEGFIAQGSPVEAVSEPVMRLASDTQAPQGVLVVLAARELPLPASPGFVFIPDGVHDPGNLGSMLRSAAAAGVEAVLLPPGGVDVYAPKVVRAAMGAHFRLPLANLSWKEIEALVERAGLQVYLAEASAGEPYARCDLGSPLALIIGGEAQGAGEAARRLSHTCLHIPMSGGVESLNAAAAAAVLLFEVARQRAIANI